MICGDTVVAGVFSRNTKPEPVEKPEPVKVQEPEQKPDDKKRGRKKNAD